MTIKVHTALYSDSGTTINQFLRQAKLWKDPRVEVVEHDFSLVYSDDWATHQPFNRMPYLVDEETGLELYESRVMCTYIANKFHSDLAPQPADTPEYWHYQKMLSVLIDHFTYNINPLLTEKYYNPNLFKQPPNEPVVEWHEKDFTKILKGYDRILAKQAWLLGDKISLIDILHANNGDIAEKSGTAKALTDGTYPNVARWWKALIETPAYQEAAKDKQQAYMDFMAKNQDGASH